MQHCTKKKVALIGGGIASISTALEIIRSGKISEYDVTIIESMSDIGKSTSYGPAGVMLFDKPYDVLPSASYDLDILSSLNFISFGIKCSIKRIIYPFKKERIKLSVKSKEMLSLMKKEFPSLNKYINFRDGNGILYIFDNIKHKDTIPNTYTIYNESETKELYPSLTNESFAFSVLSKDDGYISVKNFMECAHKILKEYNIKLIFNTSVDYVKSTGEIVFNKNSILSINNNTFDKKYDHVIVACGNNSLSVLRHLGIPSNMYTYPVKGYSIRTNSLYTPKVAMNFIERGIYSRPDGDKKTLTGGVFHISKNMDYNINYTKVDNIFHNKTLIGSVLLKDTVNSVNNNTDKDEYWIGYRPVSITGLPIVYHYKNNKVTLFNGLGANGYTFCWGEVENVINKL